MTRKTVAIMPVAVVLGAGLFYFYGGHTAPPGQRTLVALTPQNLSSIGDAFNEAKGEVRLLLLLSPT